MYQTLSLTTENTSLDLLINPVGPNSPQINISNRLEVMMNRQCHFNGSSEQSCRACLRIQQQRQQYRLLQASTTTKLY